MRIGRFALSKDSGDRNKNQVASRIPWSLLGVGLVALALSSIWNFQQRNWVALATVLVLCLGLPVFLLWRWTRWNTRAQLVVLLCYVSGTAQLIAQPDNGAGSSLLLVAVVLAGALLPPRAALFWCATIIATVFAAISPCALLVFHAVKLPGLGGVWGWLSSASGFTAIALLLYLSQQYALRRCVQSLGNRLAVGLGIDADESMGVEEALQRERVFTDAVLDSVPGLLYLYDAEGRLVRWNRKHVTMTGYNDDELARMHVTDWFRGTDVENVSTQMKRAFDEGFADGEGALVTKDGTTIPYYFTGVRLLLDGKPYLAGIGIDLTCLKAAEAQMGRTQLLYRTLFQNANDAVFLMTDGMFSDCNSMAMQLFGYPREQLVGHSPVEFSPPQQADGRSSAEVAREKVQAALRGKPQFFGWMHRRADGSLLDAEISLNRLEATAEPTLLAIVRDVTERKKAEESLRKLSQAVEQSPVNVVITDLDGNIEYVNQRFCQLTGYAFAEVLGKNPRILKSGHTSDEEYRLLWQTIKSGGEWSGEFLNKAKSGALFWERAVITSIKDETGRMTHFLAVKEDITKSKEVEEKLQQMHRQLTHVARLSTLGEMAAELAHELNHPLYAILNYTKASRNVLAEEGPPDLDQLREWNEEIAEIASSAGEAVKRLRSFARRGESPRTACRVEEIIEEALRLVAVETRRACVTVETSFSAASPPVQVDRVQIQQVLVNLLSNAVEAMQATPAETRRVMIRTSVRDGSVEIAVADRGAGLPPDAEAKIFEPFVTTKPEGMGMGLNIARSIAEAHGGALWAESNAEGGATFRFTLPVGEGVHCDAV
jgi:PAS domain S-box-containing protein